MPRKAFKVAVELEIQAVTCPGVWLCPKGEVGLRISMLDSIADVPPLPPVFPLLYHARLLFRKTVHGCRRLADLQSWLARAALRVQLVQRFGNRRDGGVIATFETSLEQLLYPAPADRGLVAGVDIDLLMEPTASFPGILAPKIEVSTRTTIEEVFNSTYCDDCDVTLVNPKMISSKSAGPRRQRQEKVCHSRARVRFICPTVRPRVCVRKQPARPFAQRVDCDPRCRNKCRPDCCVSDTAVTSTPEQPFKWQSDPANQRARRSRSQCARDCSANGLQARSKPRDVEETRSRSRCDPRDNLCDVCTSYEQVFQTREPSGCTNPASKPRPYSCLCCPCETDVPRRPEAAARRSQEYEPRSASAPLAGDTTQSSSPRTSLDDTTEAKLNVRQSFPSSYTGEYPPVNDGGYPLADVYAATSHHVDVLSGSDGGYLAGNNGGYREGNEGGYLAGNNGGYLAGNNGGYREGNEGGYLAGNNGGYLAGNNGGYREGNNGGYQPRNAGGYIRTSQHQEFQRETTSGGSRLPPLPRPNMNTSRNQFYRDMGRYYAELQHVDAPCSELCRC